jgi:hypothetical protein
VFEWTEECQRAFEESKSIFVGRNNTYFDPQKLSVVYCDASLNHIGGALTQEGKIVCCKSRTLTDTERRYSTTERECLAVVWVLKKLRKYLLGRRFIVKTDHRPLEGLFHENKATKEILNKRLENLVIKLNEFDFTVDYIPGEENNLADVLSRLMVSSVFNETEIAFGRRLELLRAAHDSEGLHHGLTKTLMNLKGKLWPGKTKDVYDFISSCECSKSKENRKPVRLAGFVPDARYPLEVIAIDLYSYGGREYLTIIDIYSKHVWSLLVKDKSKEEVGKVFQDWKSQYRMPQIVLSDRGGEFEFLDGIGVLHRRTASFRPMDNGSAERVHVELGKLSRIHNSTPDKIYHLLNSPGVISAFQEPIDLYSSSKLKRLDLVYLYRQRRGRTKDEDPWTGPHIIEEILDHRTFLLSNGDVADVSNLKLYREVLPRSAKLKTSKLLEWSKNSKLDLKSLIDVFSTQNNIFQVIDCDPWNYSWSSLSIFISVDWLLLNDALLKILHEIPQVVLICFPVMKNQEFFKILNLLPQMSSELLPTIDWFEGDEFAFKWRLSLITGTRLRSALRNWGGVEMFLSIVASHYNAN